jgi:hypothetical protein
VAARLSRGGRNWDVIDPAGTREYLGGHPASTGFAAVRRLIPSRLAISLLVRPSAAIAFASAHSTALRASSADLAVGQAVRRHRLCLRPLQRAARLLSCLLQAVVADDREPFARTGDNSRVRTFRFLEGAHY